MRSKATAWRNRPRYSRRGITDAAQLPRNRSQHLDVKQRKAAPAQVLDQVEQGDFRGVGNAMEHRFAGEKPAERHPVNAARQSRPLPAFQAVGAALPMQFAVGIQELPGDPGALRPGAGAAQPAITSLNAWSRVTSNSPRRITLARLRDTCRPSNSIIPRGSGDHHVIGSAVHGKSPELYASLKRAADMSPPTATRPSASANPGSGNLSCLPSIAGRMMPMES